MAHGWCQVSGTQEEQEQGNLVNQVNSLNFLHDFCQIFIHVSHQLNEHKLHVKSTGWLPSDEWILFTCLCFNVLKALARVPWVVRAISQVSHIFPQFSLGKWAYPHLLLSSQFNL